MALRTPLSVTPHLYMGDSTGRPLDMGTVYFGEQDKDPEFYPINLFSDDALTKPLAQPVHTKGGYLYDKGDMVEPHAEEFIYSVKVLDSYGRKVFYKGAMMRNSWNDDVIEQINAAIIGSADAARQVAIDITNDAINNTAIEGGVLADTFVTVTAKLPTSFARNQRSINAERVSILDFVDTQASDYNPLNHTAAIKRAVLTGQNINLPAGAWYISQDEFNCLGNDFKLYGDGRDSTKLILKSGTGTNFFNISNCENVIMRGLTVESDIPTDFRRIFVADPDSYIGNFDIQECRFKNRINVLRISGDQTVQPSSKRFGLNRFVFDNNDMRDLSATMIRAIDYPVYYGSYCDNTVHNFMFTQIYFATANGATNTPEINEITDFEIKRNKVTHDDDYYANEPNMAYYALALIEGKKVEYKDNSVEGMKCESESTALYDAYLNCTTVVRSGNVYRNNANFSNSIDNNLLKFKRQVKDTGIVPDKIAKNETFVIEKSWLERIGRPSCQHKLFGIGHEGSGNNSITNCTFDIDILDIDKTHLVDNLEFSDNKIKARKLNQNASATVLAVGAHIDGESTLSVVRNKVEIREMIATEIFSFINHTASSASLSFKDFVCEDNRIDAQVSSGTSNATFISRIKANRASIKRNSVEGSIFGGLHQCTFLELEAHSNDFVSTRTTGIRTLVDTVVPKTSSFKLSYKAKLDRVESMAVLETNPDTYQLDRGVTATLSIDTKEGRSSISFSYRVFYDAGVPKVSFTTTDSTSGSPVDTTQTFNALTEEGNGTVVKLVKVGTQNLSVVFNNRSRDSVFRVSGLPSTICYATLDTQVFSE